MIGTSQHIEESLARMWDARERRRRTFVGLLTRRQSLPLVLLVPFGLWSAWIGLLALTGSMAVAGLSVLGAGVAVLAFAILHWRSHGVTEYGQFVCEAEHAGIGRELAAKYYHERRFDTKGKA